MYHCIKVHWLRKVAPKFHKSGEVGDVWDSNDGWLVDAL